MYTAIDIKIMEKFEVILKFFTIEKKNFKKFNVENQQLVSVYVSKK